MMYGFLKDKKVIQCATPQKWPSERERTVGRYEAKGITVSTVFLGLNHRYGEGPGLWFETMVFGGRFDQEQQRYETWEQAEYGHKRWCKIVKFHNLWFMRIWHFITSLRIMRSET